jgi:hypothetical protein
VKGKGEGRKIRKSDRKITQKRREDFIVISS